MKKLLSILAFLFVTYNYGQTFSQTFVDRCTGEVQVVTANFSNGSAVVAFYDEVKLFTYTEFTNGTLQSWLVAKYNWWQALSPCSQAQQQTQTAQNAANNASNAASNASNATNNATQNTGTTNTGSTNTGGTASGSSGSTSSGSTSSGSSSSGSSSSGSSSGGSTEGSSGGSSSSGGDSGSSNGDSGSSSGGDSGSGSDSSGGDSGGSSDSGGGDNSSDNSGDNSGDSSDNGNSSEDNNNNTEGNNNGESEGQGDSDGSEGSSEESDTEGSGEDSSEESSETDSEESGEGSEESDSEDSESDEVEEEKKEEESEEKKEEESEEESDEEESDEEESEEESEDDSEEEEEKERRMNPIQLRADIMQQQALTLEYNSVLNIGASQSSIYGDRSYNLNGMIWDNLKQFGLSFSTSVVSMTEDYKVSWVDGVNISYMRNYTMNAVSFGANRMKPMGKYGTIGIGINYAYMFGKDALGDKMPDMYSLGYNFLYTNSFQVSPRINYAPALIVAQNPLTVQQGTEWKTSAITNSDVMGILSNSFTVQFTKRFSLNLGWTVITSTNKFVPIMNSFMVGSKIPF